MFCASYKYLIQLFISTHLWHKTGILFVNWLVEHNYILSCHADRTSTRKTHKVKLIKLERIESEMAETCIYDETQYTYRRRYWNGNHYRCETTIGKPKQRLIDIKSRKNQVYTAIIGITYSSIGREKWMKVGFSKQYIYVSIFYKL